MSTKSTHARTEDASAQPTGTKAKVQKLRETLGRVYSPEFPPDVENALRDIAGEEPLDPSNTPAPGVPVSTPEQRRE